MLKVIVINVIILVHALVSVAQSTNIHGLVYESGSNVRLAQVQVTNTRTGIEALSNLHGIFSIATAIGDTIQFKSDNHQMKKIAVGDFNDMVVNLDKVITLSEIEIKETTRAHDLKEAQLGYRKKAVFYTGTPHYYYLFLKPMTFIYENFKSEVIDARNFNKFVLKDRETTEILTRWNDELIAKVLSIRGEELVEFKAQYMPTLQQIRSMNDYALTLYIKKCYADFQATGKY